MIVGYTPYSVGRGSASGSQSLEIRTSRSYTVVRQELFINNPARVGRAEKRYQVRFLEADEALPRCRRVARAEDRRASESPPRVLIHERGVPSPRGTHAQRPQVA